MFKEGFELTSDEHLRAAMINQSEVMIWQQGEYLSHGGIIENYNDNVVRIGGAYYLRENCMFKIRKPRMKRVGVQTPLKPV